MENRTLKKIPDDQHGKLKQDAALNSKRDQKWIDEALASGPAAPLTNKEMNAVRDRMLKMKS